MSNSNVKKDKIEVTSKIATMIIKHKLIALLVLLLLPAALAYIITNFLGVDKNDRLAICFDWYGQLIGVIGLVMSVILLDSVNQKEKFLNLYNNEREQQRKSSLLNSIQEDCAFVLESILNNPEKNATFNSIVYFDRIICRDVYILVDVYQYEVKSYDELANFSKKRKSTWYTSEKSRRSYATVIRKLHKELGAIVERDSINYENRRMENSV